MLNGEFVSCLEHVQTFYFSISNATLRCFLILLTIHSFGFFELITMKTWRSDAFQWACEIPYSIADNYMLAQPMKLMLAISYWTFVCTKWIRRYSQQPPPPSLPVEINSSKKHRKIKWILRIVWSWSSNSFSQHGMMTFSDCYEGFVSYHNDAWKSFVNADQSLLTFQPLFVPFAFFHPLHSTWLVDSQTIINRCRAWLLIAIMVLFTCFF